ncbi:MAG: YybH family protein [Flavisolibacter sp.]|jgi:ketosteroid isomerase-like protein
MLNSLTPSSAESKIRELIENWAAAVRIRDIDAIIAHHSENIVMYDVPEPFESIGLDAYRKTWDLFFKYTKPGVFDILDLHITADEYVAFSYAKMKCEDKSQSTEYTTLNFRLTIGFKKINNQWFFTHEHHSIPALQ